VLAALSLGCGLLLERVSAVRIPGALLVPCGFAVLALVAQLATMAAATARLVVPAVIATALAGVVAAWPRRRPRIDWWAAAAAVCTFAAYAAPIVLSGSATFAGYIKLDDDSTLLALVDRAMEHGRSLTGLEPSTYLRVLDLLLVHGYPLATFMPLGVGGRLVGVDLMWLYQPCMALMAAMLALSLYHLAGRVIDVPWLRALAAFVAGQAALLYGYALWGGMKELGTAWALPLLFSVVPLAFRAERLRGVLPLAAVTALLFGVLNLGAIFWVGPALGYALVAIFRTRGARATRRAALAFAGSLAVLGLPTIVVAPDFLSSNIVSYDPLANLARPLSPLQVAGIWPTGDFRFDPSRLDATHVLVAVLCAAAAAGLIVAARRRAWDLALFVAGALASAFVLYGVSSPWIAGKAFATASPAIPLAALVFGATVMRSGRVVEGAVLTTVVAGGVLWSNVLQYHDAWLAPRNQLAELSTIGDRFAGGGPTLMTEYQPYGVRHFLRKLDAEGASELRFRQVTLRNGGTLDKGLYANLDELRLDSILVYRTLVLRRSPLESRPPSAYRLVSKGEWYEVWQRPDRPRERILEHLPLGGDGPAAIPACADVLRLASLPGTTRLAAVERPEPLVASLSRGTVPLGWTTDASGDVYPSGAGDLRTTVDVKTPGTYGIWVGGGFRDRLTVLMDGRRVGSRRNQLNNDGQFTQLAETTLERGLHDVTLRYGGPDPHPGSGGVQFALGPLVLSATTADQSIRYVPPPKARSLCGTNLDWIEALAS